MEYYLAYDKIAAIKNVQRMLGVRENGVYDSATRDAVLDMQKSEGIAASGIVDQATYYALVRRHAYRELCKKHTVPEGFGAFPYDVGDFGDDVMRIISEVSRLLRAYEQQNDVRGAIYSASVGRSVAILRGIFGFPIATQLDEELYARIKRENLTEIKSSAR